MKSQVFFKHGDRVCAETVVFASLGLAAFTMILAAVSSIIGVETVRDQSAPTMSAVSFPIAQDAPASAVMTTNSVDQALGVIDPPGSATGHTTGMVPGSTALTRRPFPLPPAATADF